VQWKVRHGSTTRRPVRAIPPAVASDTAPVAAPVAGPASGVAGASGSPKPRRLKLLVVDDDKFVQLLAREGLSQQFDVTVAKDGLEGLALARASHPDVVVTDALMPGLDGRQLCLSLKSDPATDDIRVVIMTSVYRHPRHESEAIRHFRADAFLRKPVTVSQLSRAVESLGPKLAVGGAG
jgi:CheY-like chemotaxis protein